MGDSGEWGADTQDRHHGVPELPEGGGAMILLNFDEFHYI